MCLVCGVMLCSQSYCCQITSPDGHSIGACTSHTEVCGAGNGMFLRIRECKVVLLSAKTKGCFVQPPYVDQVFPNLPKKVSLCFIYHFFSSMGRRTLDCVEEIPFVCVPRSIVNSTSTGSTTRSPKKFLTPSNPIIFSSRPNGFIYKHDTEASLDSWVIPLSPECWMFMHPRGLICRHPTNEKFQAPFRTRTWPPRQYLELFFPYVP